MVTAMQARSTAPISDPMMPAYTLIVPVWGQRHLARFAGTVLPSWLAAGNLPALAARGGLRTIVLTGTLDRQQIARSWSFKALEALGTLDILDVDDLFAPDHMPVTLTLAFQRGLEAAARHGAGLCIMLNSDFLLADGSLLHVAEVMERGADLVLAPSLRVIAEDIEADLQAVTAADGVIAAAPRPLTRLALRHLHHTVQTCRMDQTAVRSNTPHQLYWRADADTLAARAFCMFTLAVRLEGPPPPISTFCDYGMAACLVPGAQPVVMGHSDDFLALELGERFQEEAFAELGAPTADWLASRMGPWTTAFHRAQAAEPISFCASAPPESLPAIHAGAGRWIESVIGRMPPPQPLDDHPTWRASIRGWRIVRAHAGLHGDPPELSHVPAPPPDTAPATTDHRSTGVARALVRDFFLGRPEASPAPWQPHRPLWRAMNAACGAVPGGVRQTGQPVSILNRTLRPAAATGGAGGEAWTLAAIDFVKPASVRIAIESALSNAASGTGVILVLHRSDGGPVTAMDVALSQEIAGLSWSAEACEFVALGKDSEVHRAFGRLADWRADDGALELLQRAGRAIAGCAGLAAMALRRKGPDAPDPRQAGAAILTGRLDRLAGGPLDPAPVAGPNTFHSPQTRTHGGPA